MSKNFFFAALAGRDKKGEWGVGNHKSHMPLMILPEELIRQITSMSCTNALAKRNLSLVCWLFCTTCEEIITRRLTGLCQSQTCNIWLMYTTLKCVRMDVFTHSIQGEKLRDMLRRCRLKPESCKCVIEGYPQIGLETKLSLNAHLHLSIAHLPDGYQVPIQITFVRRAKRKRA